MGTSDFAAAKNKDYQPERKEGISKCRLRCLHENHCIVVSTATNTKKKTICRERKTIEL